MLTLLFLVLKFKIYEGFLKACDIFISAMGSIMALFLLRYKVNPIGQWVNIMDTLMGFVHFRVETLQSKQTRSKVYKHSVKLLKIKHLEGDIFETIR